MEGDGQPGVLQRRPDGVVDRVVEVAPLDGGVRAHEHRHHPRQLGDVVDLVDDGLHVVGMVHRRQGAGAEEAALALLQVLGAPVVVGARLHPAELDVGQALEPEHRRRVQHRQLDAVLVEVGEPQ